MPTYFFRIFRLHNALDRDKASFPYLLDFMEAAQG